MTVKVYNQQSEVIGEIDLPKEVFGVKWNPILVHQVLVVQEANRRKVIAHAKDRSEVRGGGRKPWRQKGTGRARHGSIRSPLWKGGGVTFGPTKERVFEKKINKKMKKIAVASVLSRKLKDQEIKIIDAIKISEPKTKIMAKILEKFFAKKRNSGLVILPEVHNDLIRATRNLSFAQITTVNNLNIQELLKYKNILFFKKAIPLIEALYKN